MSQFGARLTHRVSDVISMLLQILKSDSAHDTKTLNPTPLRILFAIKFQNPDPLRFWIKFYFFMWS